MLASLRASDVDARRRAPAGGRDAVARGEFDNGILERDHELAHADAAAAKVDQRIHHELARPVVGHLAAAVDADDRDVAGREQVFGLAIQSLREDRLVLEEPELVRRRPHRARRCSACMARQVGA